MSKKSIGNDASVKEVTTGNMIEKSVSTSCANKRRKKCPIDRLSLLPESLLLHILSFLDTCVAARTGVLSKRWQYLWTYLPRLYLGEQSRKPAKIRKFVASVHKTLVMRGGSHLDRFSVDFMYNSFFALDVNIWIEFTLKNKVKHVSFHNTSNNHNDLYMVPQLMYSNSYLISLFLRGCVMAPRRSIDWKSLIELHLSNVELRDHVIENILSGCPVLDDLILWQCWGVDHLEVNSRLNELAVEDWRDPNVGGSLLEISAPNVHTLVISLDNEGSKLRLTKISPLVIVNFDLNKFECTSGYVELTSNIKELFEELRHVKKLKLGYACIEALAVLELVGWRLPLSARTHLVVYFRADKHNIPVILDLLESSPNLETLAIHWDEGRFEEYPDESYYLGDLNCNLLQLKTVDFKCDIDPDSVSETLLIVARLLLKRARVLETMKIDFREFIPSPSKCAASGDSIAQALRSCPRSSPKAQILVCE